MRKVALIGVFCVMTMALPASAGYVGHTQISYDLKELAAGRWEYTYTVTNLSLDEPIREFTILFEHELGHRNLSVTTWIHAGWDEIAWDPQPPLADGAYDALALADGIAVGQTVTGFRVAFDWMGQGIPGKQPFDIVDPITFATLDSGYTVPEPSAMFLFALSGFLVCRSRPHRRSSQ